MVFCSLDSHRLKGLLLQIAKFRLISKGIIIEPYKHLDRCSVHQDRGNQQEIFCVYKQQQVENSEAGRSRYKCYFDSLSSTPLLFG